MNTQQQSLLQKQHETLKHQSKKEENQKQNWNQYYENLVIYDGTPIYSIKKSEPIILLIHGAGHCAMTFALLISSTQN